MLARWLALARGLLRRRAIDREVDEELAYHLEQETRMHIDRGVPPDEARRLAALSLGGLVQTRDAVRDVRTTVIESAWRETRHGIRALRATPAFTGPAVIVLALGIGGTTAVFSVLDSLLLRPLPYPEAEALVRVWSRNDDRQIPFLSISPADYEDWRRRAAALRQVGRVRTVARAATRRRRACCRNGRHAGPVPHAWHRAVDRTRTRPWGLRRQRGGDQPRALAAPLWRRARCRWAIAAHR